MYLLFYRNGMGIEFSFGYVYNVSIIFLRKIYPLKYDMRRTRACHNTHKEKKSYS